MPQQLSYHFYSSFRPAAHEQSPDHKSVDKVIRQTLPVETTTDVAHVPGENNIKALQVSNDTPIPAAKGSDGRRDSNLKKHLTRMQQENENATERETPIALKRRSGDIELPQAASKKPRLEGSDDSFSPKISVNVPASSRTRTQKPCVSKNIADAQRTRTALRTSTSDQHIGQYEDDSDDDEEKPQVRTESQNGMPESIDHKIF